MWAVLNTECYRFHKMYFFTNCNVFYLSSRTLRCRVRNKISFILYAFFIYASLLRHPPIFRRGVQTKVPMLWNVRLQTDSSDIPIRNKYVNSNRIPVYRGVISWYSLHPQICHPLTINKF